MLGDLLQQYGCARRCRLGKGLGRVLVGGWGRVIRGHMFVGEQNCKGQGRMLAGASWGQAGQALGMVLNQGGFAVEGYVSGRLGSGEWEVTDKRKRG